MRRPSASRVRPRSRRRPHQTHGFVPDVELVLTAAPDEVSVLPGAPTRVWRFTGRLLKGPADTLQTLPGSYLGPVIRLRRGQQVRVRFANQLAEDSIVHWHGLDVPERADGHPRLAIGHGREYVYEFEVTNRAGTYWYHPHPHMRTGAQVYQGLAGLLLVRDAEEDALALPSGEAELLCVLQDRRFDARNQLVFHGGGMMEMMNGFLGDRVLVNGQPQPTTEVDAAWHRVRAAERIERAHLQAGLEPRYPDGRDWRRRWAPGNAAASAGAHAGAWPTRGPVAGSHRPCGRHGGTPRQPGICRG